MSLLPLTTMARHFNILTLALCDRLISLRTQIHWISTGIALAWLPPNMELGTAFLPLLYSAVLPGGILYELQVKHGKHKFPQRTKHSRVTSGTASLALSPSLVGC
jgi:hypothetical protein